MARHKRRRRGGDPLLRQALLESRVRYGPELRGLRELLRESRTDLKIGIRAERGAAQGIQAAADEAMPEVRKVYTDAGHSADTADADVKKALAGVQGADQYKAVTAGESSAAKQRLSEAMSRAETDISSRKVQAAEGAQYGIRNLQARHQADVAKIHSQAQGLQGDIGAFVQGTYRELTGAQAKLNLEKQRIKLTARGQKLTRRGQDIQHADRIRGQNITKRGQDISKSKGGKGKPRFTRVQIRGARAMWGKGVTLIRQNKPKKDEYRDFLSFLVTKGVDRPVAVGVWETHFFGGVRKGTRRALQRDYGLRPHVVRPGRVRLTPGIQLRF